jgi:diadenylate cyclase
MADALDLVAPGQPLRDGIERVLQAKRGLLLVVGDGPEVLSICTGGFLLDAEFSPQRLSELAKMDGAVILSSDAGRIARANVHLMPNAAIPTIETGTRHRTAERVARSIDVPVVSVSAAMGLVTVYRHDARHVLQDERRLHERVRQALQTARRFRQRFDSALSSLSALEIADTVTVRDVASVLQPAELLDRIADGVKVDLVELGEDGRLLRLQLEEVLEGIDDVRRLVLRDYLAADADDGPMSPGDGHRPGRDSRVPGRAPSRSSAASAGSDGHRHGVSDGQCDRALTALSALSTDELLDVRRVSAVLGVGGAHADPDAPIEPRGYRLLHRLPRFPELLVDRIVEHFAGLQRIMRTSVGDLEEVEGVGEARARSVKEGLARLAEASILDRYS